MTDKISKEQAAWNKRRLELIDPRYGDRSLIGYNPPPDFPPPIKKVLKDLNSRLKRS